MNFSQEVIVTFLILLTFISAHILGRRLSFLDILPRCKWLSFASGVSIAYVFVYLLPELASLLTEYPEMSKKFEDYTFIMAFLGLLIFYGLEKLSRKKSLKGEDTTNPNEKSSKIFWLHTVAFSLYNFIIGYLLLHHILQDWFAIITYGIALSLHLLVIDKSLRDIFGKLYHKYGRWILSFALLLGWFIGIFAVVSKFWIDLTMAFLSGGIMLNVLKEELPLEKQSNYPAFASGALIYAFFIYVFL